MNAYVQVVLLILGSLVVIGGLIVLQIDTQRYEAQLDQPDAQREEARGFEVMRKEQKNV